MVLRTALIAAVFWAQSLSVSAFLPRQTLARCPTQVFGINEWRDTFFNFPGNGDDRRLGKEEGGAPKEICILPFPYDEVLLQGETKQLRLYEDRFIKLFDHCMEKHSGVVAMGLLAESGIIQTVPICEIEAYNRMEGFGIFVTIRVVGRGRLLDITQQEPYLTATAVEITDTIPANLELPNLVASNIENFMLLLSSMEHRLSQAMEESEDEEDDDDKEMKKRIQIAKLDDRFYDDLGDDEEDVLELDRRGRFRQAYSVALETDTQGYCLPKSSDIERTPQELTALSWAAFCTNLLPEEDAAFRIQALDSDDLFERLKLGSHMLREKKNLLREQMKKAGLKFKGGEFDEDF
mmetsp:Transcript_102239/g.295821  ORF Transcript_102239/g.295821 Transcript_102239/m.295821 type:complete len:350 (-) Transcript_102239:1743-2792(-)